MFQNLNYQRKFQLLILFSVALGIAVYQLALSKTINLYHQNSLLNIQLADAENAPDRLEVLKKSLYHLDQITKNNHPDSIQNNHDLLLSSVSEYCKEKGLILKNFPETSIYKLGDYEVETNSFTVQGGFLNLLKLIYKLEQEVRVGNISSVMFQSAKDSENQKLILTATVYLQTAKNLK